LIKIDGGIETELMKKYNIEGLPVFILYKNGKEVWRHEGIADKKEFEKAIKKNS
jgi:thioredoxin-related protein